MYFVYILLSKKDKNLYVGCTTDLTKRLKCHNLGKVLSTQRRTPLILIHKEKFQNKSVAFSRERFLKSLWAGRFKRKLKDKYLDGLNQFASAN